MAETNPAPQIDKQNVPESAPEFLKPTSPAKPGLDYYKSAARALEASDGGRPQKKPRLAAPPFLTAAAALAEERASKIHLPSSQERRESSRTSPNPGFEALNKLSGGLQNAMSKASDAPAIAAEKHPAVALSQPMAVVANTVQQPAVSEISTAASDAPALTSPTSLSSAGTLESLPIPSIPTTVAGSPQLTEEPFRQPSGTNDSGSTSPNEGHKAFSYPNPLLQPPLGDPMNRRGNSLPHSSTRQGTRSPSSKKHQCPYCATEFTRQHNLKSHLLTHSQEKPYLCTTCSARFRRLHDLKRHSKLHTGERPHTCPRCKRKFARGDALARHNKGPGGCANRRASQGDYAGDDGFDGGDDSMDGVVYHEPETMDEDEGSDRVPSIRRQAPSGDDHGTDDSDHYSRISSTYPPIQGRPPGGMSGSLFQPRGGFVNTGTGSSSGLASVPASTPPVPFPHASGSQSSSRPGANNSIFAQNPLTESPKPLSPGQTHSRGPSTIDSTYSSHRSPSLTHYHPQQPPPSQAQSAASHARSSSGPVSALGVLAGGPQLPLPHTLHLPPDPRYTLPNQIGPTHPPTQPSGPPTHMNSGPLSSNSNSHSSHGQSGHGSTEGLQNMFNKDDRIWAYVKSLEQRMNGMQEENKSLEHKVNSMQDDIINLRSRLATTGQNPLNRA